MATRRLEFPERHLSAHWWPTYFCVYSHTFPDHQDEPIREYSSAIAKPLFANVANPKPGGGAGVVVDNNRTSSSVCTST